MMRLKQHRQERARFALDPLNSEPQHTRRNKLPFSVRKGLLLSCSRVGHLFGAADHAGEVAKTGRCTRSPIRRCSLTGRFYIVPHVVGMLCKDSARPTAIPLWTRSREVRMDTVAREDAAPVATGVHRYVDSKVRELFNLTQKKPDVRT